MALKALLQDTNLGAVVARRPIVACRHNETLSHALELMRGRNLLSLPVTVGPDIAPPPEAHASVMALLGFIGVQDVLEALIDDLDNHGGAAADLEAVGKEICSRSVGSFFGDFSGPATTAVLSMSDVCRDWGIKGYLNAPLIDVIRYNFLHAQPPTLPAHRVHTVHYDVVHRIAVFDSAAHADNGGGLDIIGVLSQSDVIAFLQAHAAQLGGFRDLPVAHLLRLATDAADSGTLAARGHRGLVCVAENTPTLDAFRTMKAEKVSAVAVVSADGRLVGNLSASDLRRLAPGHFGALRLSVDQFLGSQPLREQGAAASAPAAISCSPDCKVKDAIELLSSNRVHRVYVVDEAGRPTACLTLTDILAAVVEWCDDERDGP